MALALALGYRQLAATRGRFAANVLVLDEVWWWGGLDWGGLRCVDLCIGVLRCVEVC